MKLYFSTLLLTVFLMTGQSIAAERADTSSSTASYIVGLHPLQLIVNGFKVELERRAAQSAFSFSVSPEFYFGTFDHADNNIMLFANHSVIDVLGYGVNVSGRYYVSELFNRVSSNNKFTKYEKSSSNFYLFSALEYRYFDLSYYSRGWVAFRENGVDLYKLSDIEQTNTVQRIGFNLGIGNTVFLGDRFYIDFFVYSRISKAFQAPKMKESTPFKDDFFTLTGNSFALGFRFGLLLE